MIGCRRPVLLLTALAIGVYLFHFDAIDRQYSGRFYRYWYGSKRVDRVVYTRYSPYHKIEVASLTDGERMLLLNGKRQFAPGSHHTYSYFVAEYPAKRFTAPTVAVLGCGSMSTVGRIGTWSPSITIVDIDPEVFKTSRRFFPEYNHLGELNNWRFVADDAKHFLAATPQRFDLILHDIPPARSRQTALTYTAEFFRLVKNRLTPGGMFSIASLTPIDSSSPYGKRMLATLASVFDRYVVFVYRGDAYFYGGGPELVIPDEDTLRQAIRHPGREKVTILFEDDVRRLVDGYEVITVNNVGDLIFAG